MRGPVQAVPDQLLRALPRRGRFRLALAIKPGPTEQVHAVTPKLRGGLVMRLDLCDHLQRGMAADCFERPEEDVTLGLLRPGDVVLDVGANVGYHGLRWGAGRRPERAVVAFEPAPPKHHALVANLELNRDVPAEAHRLALGDREGTLAMSSDRLRGDLGQLQHEEPRARRIRGGGRRRWTHGPPAMTWRGCVSSRSTSRDGRPTSSTERQPRSPTTGPT